MRDRWPCRVDSPGCPRLPAWIVTGAVLALVAPGCRRHRGDRRPSQYHRAQSTTSSIAADHHRGARVRRHVEHAQKQPRVWRLSRPTARRRPRRALRALKSTTLDGDLYAQPFIVGNRAIVATENDTVYALNATHGENVLLAHSAATNAGRRCPAEIGYPVGIPRTPSPSTAAEPGVRRGHYPARPALIKGTPSRDRPTHEDVRVDAPGADPAVQNQRDPLRRSATPQALSPSTAYVPFTAGGHCGGGGLPRTRRRRRGLERGPRRGHVVHAAWTHGQGGFWTPPRLGSVAAHGSLYLTIGRKRGSGEIDERRQLLAARRG